LLIRSWEGDDGKLNPLNSLPRSPKRLPSFWAVQLVAWVGIALLSFPLKVSAFGTFSAAIVLTLFREPLALLMTSGFRLIFQRLERRSGSLLRRVLWSMPMCLLAAAVDLAVGLAVTSTFNLALPSYGIGGFFYFRVLLYCGWCSAYFLIKEYTKARLAQLALVQAEASAREAEVLMLRAQVSPHFLFNAFNTILADLESRPAAVAPLVQGLSDYFRYSLTNSHRTFVTIGDEFDAIVSYLAVSKARFRESLLIECSIDPAVRAVKVPGVCLQPLVENALLYGHQTSETPLRIWVEVKSADGVALIVRVTNSGRWVDRHEPRPQGHSRGHGLTTLRRRLELLYPETHVLTAGPDEGTGSVSVQFKLLAATEGAPCTL